MLTIRGDHWRVPHETAADSCRREASLILLIRSFCETFGRMIHIKRCERSRAFTPRARVSLCRSFSFQSSLETVIKCDAQKRDPLDGEI